MDMDQQNDTVVHQGIRQQFYALIKQAPIGSSEVTTRNKRRTSKETIRELQDHLIFATEEHKERHRLQRRRIQLHHNSNIDRSYHG